MADLWNSNGTVKETTHNEKAFVERPSWHPFLSCCFSMISATWEEYQ